MSFTDDEIRALVNLGQFDDRRAAEHIAKTLLRRRDKIGRAFFAQVAPLDKFAVHDGRLTYEDLAAKYGFRDPIPVASSGLQSNGISTLRQANHRVDIYLRAGEVVGISRSSTSRP